MIPAIDLCLFNYFFFISMMKIVNLMRFEWLMKINGNWWWMSNDDDDENLWLMKVYNSLEGSEMMWNSYVCFYLDDK